MKQNHQLQSLVPLQPNQHPVSALPKFTTDLPFFYLTKQKGLLSQTINYEGKDGEGRPIRWKVTPNTNPEIGAPGIEAHEVWIRLLRPAIDSKKTPDGKLASIIPLGKVRECLRLIGWAEGGWEARDFLKAIRQIGSAWCKVDFWLPTIKTDTEGRPLYKQIKGEFSRMSIYAIGSRHVTEADLEQGNISFDFDLDDTVYVQLDPLEVQMQSLQPQRLIDNEYLFSVGPSARRWYELLAPKIFGVVKNKGEYCEIRYSWYIKHHPTLKRYYERRRVVHQMNRLIKDHLDFGYVHKLEYRKVIEKDQELDFIIRYYPGEGAKLSISRILSHTYSRKFPITESAKTLVAAPPKVAPLNRAPTKQPEKQATQESGQQMPSPGTKPAWTEEEIQLIRQLNESFGVAILKAGDLVRTAPDQTRRQIEAWPFREVSPKNMAGWIINAIETNYELPPAYIEAAKQKSDRAEAEVRRAAIAACVYCRDSSGWRVTQRGARQCTHDPVIEDQIKIA